MGRNVVMVSESLAGTTRDRFMPRFWHVKRSISERGWYDTVRCCSTVLYGDGILTNSSSSPRSKCLKRGK